MYGHRTIVVLSLRTIILILLYHFASEVILVLVKACIRCHIAALLPSESRLPQFRFGSRASKLSFGLEV